MALDVSDDSHSKLRETIRRLLVWLVRHDSLSRRTSKITGLPPATLILICSRSATPVHGVVVPLLSLASVLNKTRKAANVSQHRVALNILRGVEFSLVARNDRIVIVACSFQ